ncbi:MAG: hypothetical protein ACD_45C00043G0001 [uncultured bacterium]|nr:MAG: hypothetical protein ACD_45C00043G0001 [uncultured bacterium]
MVILSVLVLGLDFASPLVVVENTDKHDVMSAVVLGDTEKSKILTADTLSQPVQKKTIVQSKIPEPISDLTPTPLPIPKPKIVKQAFEKDLLDDLKKFKIKKKPAITQQQLKEVFQKSLHATTEKTMRQSLLSEKIKMKSTMSREAQGIVNRYQALIQQAISEHWVIPPQSNKKAFSVLLIHLSRQGTVLDVQIAQSSGDPALDYSARAAVFKASPLPVPDDPQAFEAFKQFRLKAKPENVMQ